MQSAKPDATDVHNDELIQFEQELLAMDERKGGSSSNRAALGSLRQRRVSLCKRYKGCNWTQANDRYVDLWLTEAEECADPMQVYCYMYRHRIGTQTDSFYRKWFDLMVARRQFLIAHQLLQRLSKEIKDGKLPKSAPFCNLIAGMKDALSKSLRKFYTKYFDKLVRKCMFPKSSQITYLVTKYDSDQVGISEGDFEDIRRTTLDSEIDRQMDRIYTINEPVKKKTLKRKVSLKDLSSPTFNLVPIKVGKVRRFSDIIGGLNRDKYPIFMDKEGQQNYLGELEFQVYEFEFLCHRFKKEVEEALGPNWRREAEETAEGRDFWVRTEHLELKQSLFRRQRCRSSKLKSSNEAGQSQPRESTLKPPDPQPELAVSSNNKQTLTKAKKSGRPASKSREKSKRGKSSNKAPKSGKGRGKSMR